MNNSLINPPNEETTKLLYDYFTKHHIQFRNYSSYEEMMNLLPITETLSNISNLESFNNFLLDSKKSNIYFSSSGSTGDPKLIQLNFDEVLNNSRIHGKGYQLAGITPQDRVATWGLRGLMDSEFTVYLGLSHTGATIFPIGDYGKVDNLYLILSKIQPTVLLVMPSDLIPLVNFLENNKLLLSGIRLLVFGGEPLGKAEEKRFISSIPSIQNFRGVYQSSETGTLGYQCTQCKRGHFHLHDENYIFEISGSNNSNMGNLIVTNFNRKLLEVIRYKTGDIVKKVTLNCYNKIETGIQIIGRDSDLIKFGGEKFDTSWFKSIASKFDIPISDFIVELRKSNLGKDQFCIYSNKINSDFTIQENIENSFRKISVKWRCCT